MTTRETPGNVLSGKKTIRESNYPGNDCKPVTQCRQWPAMASSMLNIVMQVRWDKQPGNHTFWLLSKHCVSRYSARMPDETDVKKILTAALWRTGGDHQDALILCGWILSSYTWNPITSPWMKQLT